MSNFNITIYHGPGRDAMLDGITLDYPFGRKHPNDVPPIIDLWIERELEVELVTAEEMSMLYLQFLIGKGTITPDQVFICWVPEDKPLFELRLGTDGDLMDPWPTGFFDDKLKLILGILDSEPKHSIED